MFPRHEMRKLRAFPHEFSGEARKLKNDAMRCVLLLGASRHVSLSVSLSPESSPKVVKAPSRMPKS